MIAHACKFKSCDRNLFGFNLRYLYETRRRQIMLEKAKRHIERGCIMYMGMVLTRTHCYVAEFGLNLGPSTSQGPASVHTLPGSSPGAPPTGHRAQTPWRPLLPQPMHCKHPRIRRNRTRTTWGWGIWEGEREGGKGKGRSIPLQARGLENERKMRY